MKVKLGERNGKHIYERERERERESDITPCVQRYERDVEVERRHCFYSMREERRIDWIRKRERERREREKERKRECVCERCPSMRDV